MFGTKKVLQDRVGNRWAIELLQIYHMPIMNIRQGWHMLDVCENEELALKRMDEIKAPLLAQCELRIRELTNTEEHEIV